VAAYCAGRGWIEYMRVDEAHHILGLRLNVWTAIIVFVLAVVYMVVSARVRPGREEIVEPRSRKPVETGKTDDDAEDAADAGTGKAASDDAADPDDADDSHDVENGAGNGAGSAAKG